MHETQRSDFHFWEDSDQQPAVAAKRRRISLSQDQLNHASRPTLFSDGITRKDASQKQSAVIDNCDDGKSNISISAMSKHAGQTVAPFLAKHIPDQYASAGGQNELAAGKSNDPNTKYCYRHRPDLKCRRQANEPSMDQLQKSLEGLSTEDQTAITHVWSIFSAAPAKQRNLMLQGILTQCCFPQLSYVSSSVRELIRIDFMTALPPEISFRILCFLDTKSLCNAAQVSQRWRILADDDVVWHRMCEQHIDRKCVKCGWGLPLLERKRLRASKRQIQLRATSRGLNEWSPKITPFPEEPCDRFNTSSNDAKGTLGLLSAKSAAPAMLTPQASTEDDSYFRRRTRPWKEVYKDRFKVGTNWKYGRCDVKIFQGHQNGVMCLQFDERILATGSYDTTIKIWDLHSGEEQRTMKGHSSAVRCLQFDNTKLISGGLDGRVKVWNWRTGECLSTLSGHSGGIIGLHFDSSLLATGSVDGTVRIWNFDDKSSRVLRGHTDWVNSVKIDTPSRTVFSASDDSTVKLWDLDTNTCIKTFEGHVGQVQQVMLLPHDYEFEEDNPYGHDGTGSTMSTQTPPPLAIGPSVLEPYGPGFETCDRHHPPRYILTSALDSTIRLWDTYTGKTLRTYFGHVEGVWALAADTLRVVSGAQDRTVKIWDTKGKCEKTFIGHAGPVTCIGLSDSRMCSGGEDCDVRMYSFRSWGSDSSVL